MIINTLQFNLILSLVFLVFFYQFCKLAVKNCKKDGAATIILQFIAGSSVLVWAPLFPLNFPDFYSNLKIYNLIFLSIIFYAVSDRLQTTVRKNLEVSVFSTINQLSNVFIIIIGLTVFRESFVIYKVIGALLILVGNASIFYEKGKFKLNKYVIIAIFSNMALAVAVSAGIDVSKLFNLPIYISITLIGPAIIVKIFEKIPIKTIIEEYKHGNKKYFYATGIFWGLTIFFYFRSFQFGEIITIVPIKSTAVLLNVIVAYFLLHERKNLLKKIIAAIIVMAGISLTVLN